MKAHSTSSSGLGSELQLLGREVEPSRGRHGEVADAADVIAVLRITLREHLVQDVDALPSGGGTTAALAHVHLAIGDPHRIDRIRRVGRHEHRTV
jgi:hypothetical protein